MTHLEIEYKTLLSHSEYHHLLSLFSDVQPVSQTNYYIDTPDKKVKEARCSLRIRTLPNRAELTLKVPQAVGNLEYNQDLTSEEANQLIHLFQLPSGKIKDYLMDKQLPIDQLTIWGHLTTKRYEKETALGLMALDANSYVGQSDYELEVEVTDAKSGKIAFENFLSEQAIQFKYASSKVARLAKQLKAVK